MEEILNIGDDGLVANMGSISAQSPEFKFPDRLATFQWNNHRVA